MSWPGRCNRCRARYAQDVNPEHEDPPVRCLCGGIVKVDWYRKNREWKGRTCSCDGYMFPHRNGSPKCKYDKDGKSKWGEVEIPDCLDEAKFPF